MAFPCEIGLIGPLASKIKAPVVGGDSLSSSSVVAAAPLKRSFDSLSGGEEPLSKRPGIMDMNAMPGGMMAANGVPGGMMAPGGAGGVEAPATEIIMVPDKMVGLIIGRGGEQITRLQAEYGCKIQMAQDSAGQPDRQCTLTGAAVNISQARAAIERIVANEGNGPPRGAGGPGGPGAAPGGGFFEMMVPGHKVGLIIGKGGESIKQLQEQSGAKIVIIQDTPEAAMEKPLRITGSPEAVERAKQLVTEILNQGDERDMGFGGRGRGRGSSMMRGMGGAGTGGRGGFGMPRGRGGPRGGMTGGQWGAPSSEYGGQATEYVQVPSNKCGLVIGKGGETIKNINQSTGAHCEIDKHSAPDAREKTFVIRGSPEAVERAKSMVLEKLGMQGGYGGGAGGYGGGGGAGGSWGGGSSYGGGYDGGAGGVNPQTGQADFSAQWAEYYRTMGMVKEAEAIEASRANASAPAAPAAAAAPGNGAQNGSQDYSAQWAEYYRSIGKLKEAEAIEAQMKQKVGSAPSGTPSYPTQYATASTGYYGGNSNPIPFCLHPKQSKSERASQSVSQPVDTM
eukprot:TCALIF_07858-PA protein Name:"Similar to Fubp1 Far upstream element-binding protein 1 (Mus musculus)" AED:0.11 eAED:0.11 QI:0/0/0/0.4/1/1/5/0/564